MNQWVAILAVLLLSSPALAGNWGRLRGGSCSGNHGSVSGGETLCYDPSATDDDSTILVVGLVENFDVFYHEDKDGDGDDCGVSITIEHCPDRDADLSASAEDNACKILAGTSPLSNGNRVESNLAGTFIRLNVAATGANPTDCRVLLKGALRSN